MPASMSAPPAHSGGGSISGGGATVAEMRRNRATGSVALWPLRGPSTSARLAPSIRPRSRAGLAPSVASVNASIASSAMA